MKILFTGASSFTGLWFVRGLADAGHDVTAVFRQRPEGYPDGLRRQRVTLLTDICRPVYECAFGDDLFLETVGRSGPWDVLCHHAADVTNYKSPDFDVAAAVANNTRNLPRVLEAITKQGCGRIVLTGSVFEQGEGAGSDNLRAFSPYGLSKGFTAEVFRYEMAIRGLSLGKFVIPNPFGPHEEPRFTSYLVRNWLAGEVPSVRTPDYVRDNIHVSLLAPAYVKYVETLTNQAGYHRFSPSQYVETQGAFANRFAVAMSPRLGIECPLELRCQREFEEPRVRINTEPVDALSLGWDEEAAWDELSDYYRTVV